MSQTPLEKIELSIVIIDYNTSYYLLNCLKSIKDNSPESRCQIIIIDNDSKEDHLKEYEAIDKRIITSRLESNLGFGGGNNAGAKLANGQYILFLNPDTLIVDNSIGKMVQFLKNQPQAGAVCPRIQVDDNPNSDEEVDYYGDFPTLQTLVSRHNHRHVFDRGEYLEVERVTGACMMMRKTLFDQAGGFDENFFMYFEDTDLSKKVFDLGYKNCLLNNTAIVHYGGKSQKSSKLKKERYYAAQDYFLKKHAGLLVLLLAKTLRFPHKILKGIKT